LHPQGARLVGERRSGGAASRGLFFSGIILLAMYLILDLVVGAGLSQTWDMNVFFAVNSMIFPAWLDSAMVLFSLYGREVVWGGLIVALFFLGGEREKRAALTMGLIFLLLIGAGYVAKGLDSRLRPYDALGGVRLLVPGEPDASFPSGHTLIVAGGAVVAWLSLKRELAVFLTVEAVLVALSRMYVGVHYPTDLVGGALLGAGLALIVCSQPNLLNDIYEKVPHSVRESGRYLTAC
jgi:undecaprenyl-diphosphatase